MAYNELTRELETDRIAVAAAAAAVSPERADSSKASPSAICARTREARSSITWRWTQSSRAARRGGRKCASVESAWQLTLVAGDRPGLFASVAGTLARFGMNILRAEAFSNRRGLVLDTFPFADPNRTLDLNPSEVDRLRTTAERVIYGQEDVRELLQNRPKPQPPSRKARIPDARLVRSGRERQPPR